MDLNSIFNLVHQKTYYSRTDAEVWHAISNAASTLFLQVIDENRGFFIKFDTSSVVLALNVEDYALPADCDQLLRIRERLNSQDEYRRMTPADLNDSGFVDAQFASSFGPDTGGPVSSFRYWGPFLLMADAQSDAQASHIRVEPPPQDARQVEIVYASKFVEISSADSVKTLPNEADDAVIFNAVAQLLGDNGDDPTSAANEAAKNERAFLKWVRKRQAQAQRTQDTYVDDLD